MSKDTKRTTAPGTAPTGASAPEGMTLSRRHFLEGIGAAAGLVAAGALPAALSVVPNLAVASESEGGEAECGIEWAVEEDEPVNYPGQTWTTRLPPATRSGRW